MSPVKESDFFEQRQGIMAGYIREGQRSLQGKQAGEVKQGYETYFTGQVSSTMRMRCLWQWISSEKSKGTHHAMVVR